MQMHCCDDVVWDSENSSVAGHFAVPAGLQPEWLKIESVGHGTGYTGYGFRPLHPVEKRESEFIALASGGTCPSGSFFVARKR